MLRSPSYWLFAIAALLLTAFALTSPVWYDDAGHWLVARHLAETGDFCYPLDAAGSICDPLSPFITMGPSLTGPAAVWIRLFGADMTLLRFFVLPFSLTFLFVYHKVGSLSLNSSKANWALLLVLLNIQFLTYGAQFLGEVPMLLFLFAGLYTQLRWMRSDYAGWLLPLLTVACWWIAIDIKAYVALPLGLLLGLQGIALLWKGPRGRAWIPFAQGALLTITVLGALILRFGMEDFKLWLELRGSYTNEFLTFAPGEALRFLAFKPLIYLGGLALAVRLYVKRDPVDRLLFAFFCLQLIFFLLSAGFDRFGFQLIFIPALYFGELLLAAWNRIRIHPKRFQLGLGFFAFLFILFSQQTFPTLGKRLLGSKAVNTSEKEIALWCAKQIDRPVYTFDQQIIPFLHPDQKWMLTGIPPSAAGDWCAFEPMHLPIYPDYGAGHYLFVEGEYGQTNYSTCLDPLWLNFEIETRNKSYRGFTYTSNGSPFIYFEF